MTAGKDFKKPSESAMNRRRPPIPYWSRRRKPPIPNFLKGEMEEVRIQLKSLAKDVLEDQRQELLLPPKKTSTAVKLEKDMDKVVTSKRSQVKDGNTHSFVSEQRILTPAPQFSSVNKLKVKQKGFSHELTNGEETLVELSANIYQSANSMPSSRCQNGTPEAGTSLNVLNEKKMLASKDKENAEYVDTDTNTKTKSCSVRSLVVGFKSGCLLQSSDTGHQCKPVKKKSGMTQSSEVSQMNSIVDSSPSTCNHHVKQLKRNEVLKGQMKKNMAFQHVDSFRSRNEKNRISWTKLVPQEPILSSEVDSVASKYPESVAYSETSRAGNAYFGGSEMSMFQTPIKPAAQYKNPVSTFLHKNTDNHCKTVSPREGHAISEEASGPKNNDSQHITIKNRQKHSDQIWVQQRSYYHGSVRFSSEQNQYLGITDFRCVPTYYFNPGASEDGDELQLINGHLPNQFSNQTDIIYEHQHPIAYNQPLNTFQQPCIYQQHF